jgi:hypothetical protein
LTTRSRRWRAATCTSKDDVWLTSTGMPLS